MGDYFGDTDPDHIDRVVENWFDDSRNYDGRWSLIQRQLGDHNSLEDISVLDMAAGCGTFVFYGLKQGYDVWGIEPERWKLTFISRKAAELGYPRSFLSRFIGSLGEALPFPDRTFDVVTTYQTLEHVQDVGKCLREMLRVLRIGGHLHVSAPDYNSSYEPHYRLPVLPQMNRKLAGTYLRLLGRPTIGLETIQYITRRKVVRKVIDTGTPVMVEDLNEALFHNRRARILDSIHLPKPIRSLMELDQLTVFYKLLIQARILGRRENSIRLWITKLSDAEDNLA